MQFKASFWDFVNCIQLAEGVQEAGVGLVFTDTQDIPLTWDIFCFAVWIAVASIFTGPSKQAKPVTKPCPCATRVIFPLDKSLEIWDSQDTKISFQKERRAKENSLFPSPHFKWSCQDHFKTHPSLSSSSPPPSAARLPSCNLSFTLKAASFCVSCRRAAYPRQGFHQGASL